MKDWKLVIIIGLFVLCGILLLLLRLVVPQFRVSPSLSSNREYPNELNVRQHIVYVYSKLRLSLTDT